MSKSCAMVVACIFFCACSDMSMLKGRFDVPVQHNFIGVGKELPQKSSVSNVAVSAVYVQEDSLRIRDLYNEKDVKDGYSNPTKIDFVYKLNNFPIMVSYTYIYKGELCVAGVSASIGRYLFGRFIFGVNDKNYEVGMYGDLGYGFDQGSYDYRYDSGGLFGGGPYGDSTYSDKYIGHYVTSFGLYASYYYGPLGVTYSPSVYAPWQRRDLPVNAKGNVESEGAYDINFKFPQIVSQYLGLSFWITDHWKISGGVTFLTPVDFNDFAMTGNTSVGFWF